MQSDLIKFFDRHWFCSEVKNNPAERLQNLSCIVKNPNPVKLLTLPPFNYKE